MKRYIFSLLTIFTFAISALAQNQMHVFMKDGSSINLYVTEIDHVEWDSNSDELDINDPDDSIVTGNVINVTANSATIEGYANNVRDNEASDLKIGIIYCTEGTPSKSNGTQLTVTKSQVANDGKYVVDLTGLTSGTVYYYRSYIYQNGLWFYGKVHCFTTTRQDIQIDFITDVPTAITCYSAKVNTRMILTTSQDYGSLSYGICYGTTAGTSENIPLNNCDGQGRFSTTLRSLKGNTIYYWRPYATIDGTTFYGTPSSFKTLEDNVVVTGKIDTDGNVCSRLTIGDGIYDILEVGLCWSKNELPTVNENYASTNELDDENYYVITPVFGVGTFYYRAYVKIDGVAHYGSVKTYKSGSMPPSHAVDLGLSVKWADMNVGAKTAEDYGDYFSWGETEPKSVCNWNTYFDSVNGSYSNFNKYYNHGGKNVLDSEDDAASANWGKNWRLPTRAELEELLNNCSWLWTTLNDVEGYMVTSKSNGNSIFLPAAGYCHEDSLHNNGSGGYYWSNSLQPTWSFRAYSISFDFSNMYGYNGNRADGQSVRPVCQ